MKRKFRYDYNSKILVINILVSLLFLVIFVASFDKGLVIFFAFGLVFLICLANTIILVFNQGITIRKENILIVDYFWFTKINFANLKRVELKHNIIQVW